MELVNNRYRVIKNLKQNRQVSAYLVSDMWDENREMQLNILNAEFIPDSLIEYYSSEFISLISLDSEDIVRDYTFNIVSHIDNKRTEEEQYFYTCEYFEDTVDIFEYTGNMDIFEITSVFMELCKAVNYLHLKGYVHGALNPGNILIVKQNDGFKLKLKDLATVELEKNFYPGDNSDDSFFKSPRLLSGKTPHRSADLYSLGIILLALLEKMQGSEIDPKDKLSRLLDELKNNNLNGREDALLHKLISTIRKLVSVNEDSQNDYIYGFISELHAGTVKDFSIVCREDIEKLNFHTKIIGRDEEINSVLKAYDSMIKYKPVKKIFLVQGDTGTGKTRFLKELKFLLEFKRANVYSSFNLSSAGDSNNRMWSEILRKLVLETDSETIEKYEAELMKFFPGIIDRKNTSLTEYLNEGHAKYRLLNRIAGFIGDSIKNRPAIIIVDNIQLANEFTIDTFTYLYSEVSKNKNIILIFSYKGGEAFDNPRFSEFIASIKKRKDSDTIFMRNLDNEHSSELIKCMLSMPHAPVKLAERIYSQSYGNPLFISEVIKDLFIRRTIYVNNETGMWSINLQDQDQYKYLSLPDTIEQAVLNQLKDSKGVGYEILKAVSIFNNPVSIEDLSGFINSNVENLDMVVKDLVGRGILCSKISDSGYVYDFNNRVLKNIVYERIDSDEKIQKHKIAASILEAREDAVLSTNMDELIFHLERAGIRDKAKKCCIQNARKMKEFKDMKAEIANLEKALSMVDNQDKAEETELLTEIGTLYFETGDVQTSKEYFSKAEELASITGNKKHLVDVFINIAQSLANENETAKVLSYLDKADEILKSLDYPGARLEYMRLNALMLQDQNLLDECIELCLETIDKCGENFNRTKGNTCRILAVVYLQKGRTEESLEINHKAIELLETVGYTRGILFALNNIGDLYSSVYEDFEKALSYFIRVRDLSEEYGLLSSQLLAFTNIAGVYYTKYEYALAYDYFKLALEKAFSINFEGMIFYIYTYLVRVCLHMNNYAEALDYHNLCSMELESFPNQGRDIVELYKANTELFNALGDFESAGEYIKKSIQSYMKEVSMSKFECIINSQILKIRFREPGTCNSNVNAIISASKNFRLPESKILNLCNAAVVAAEKDDTANAKKLLQEAQKHMTESVHDVIKANYYYAEGICKSGENAVKTLLSGLKLAKKIKDRELAAKINTHIGDCYFSMGKFYSSASYYIEACALLREIIDLVPDRYKLSYVNSYRAARAFMRIKYSKAMFIDGDKHTSEPGNIFEVKSLDELAELLGMDEVGIFMGNKDFMQFLSERYMSTLSKGILCEKDILSNISSDAIKDIKMVTRYLAAAALATRGLVVMESQRQDLSVIVSTNKNYDLPSNRYIFDRVKSTMEPVWISRKLAKDESDISFLPEDIKACMCIPITSSYSEEIAVSGEVKASRGFRNDIIGYLYLESDRILNYFNDEGLEKCTQFINLLALLIEKHQLKQDASVDKLTGALTRKYLDDALNDAMDRSNSSRESFSVIMYDLDRFKNVNDRFGLQTGDEVLKKVSRVIMDNIGRSDQLGRYGGEEFIIILPAMDSIEALSAADELRKKVELERILGDKAEVTISMGIVSYPAHGQSVQELIDKVDQALYAAKKNGRNRCQVWENDFSNKAMSTNKLSGIISGNMVQDSRNTLAIVELIQLINKGSSKKDKIYSFLGRMIEITEAQSGALLLVEQGQVTGQLGRVSQQEEWADSVVFNRDIVKSVIESKQGTYMIDWDDVENHDLITGMPEWYSILAVPITSSDEIKGVIYLSAPTRLKEFGVNELNFISILSDLASAII